MIEHYAVMGKPIAHSLSPVIHLRFAAQVGKTISYEKILVEPSAFAGRVMQYFQQGGKGLNITLPLKEQAYGCR